MRCERNTIQLRGTPYTHTYLFAYALHLLGTPYTYFWSQPTPTTTLYTIFTLHSVNLSHPKPPEPPTVSTRLNPGATCSGDTTPCKVTAVILHGFVLCAVTPAILYGVVLCKVTPVILHGVVSPECYLTLVILHGVVSPECKVTPVILHVVVLCKVTPIILHGVVYPECKVTPVILHGVVSPQFRSFYTRLSPQSVKSLRSSYMGLYPQSVKSLRSSYTGLDLFDSLVLDALRLLLVHPLEDLFGVHHRDDPVQHVPYIRFNVRSCRFFNSHHRRTPECVLQKRPDSEVPKVYDMRQELIITREQTKRQGVGAVATLNND